MVHSQSSYLTLGLCLFFFSVYCLRLCYFEKKALTSVTIPAKNVVT